MRYLCEYDGKVVYLRDERGHYITGLVVRGGRQGYRKVIRDEVRRALGKERTHEALRAINKGLRSHSANRFDFWIDI